MSGRRGFLLGFSLGLNDSDKARGGILCVNRMTLQPLTDKSAISRAFDLVKDKLIEGAKEYPRKATVYWRPSERFCVRFNPVQYPTELLCQFGIHDPAAGTWHTIVEINTRRSEQSRSPRLVLVLPSMPGNHTRPAIEKVGIEVLLYCWNNDEPEFPKLSALLGSALRARDIVER